MPGAETERQRIALVGLVFLTVWYAPPLVVGIISALGGIAIAQASHDR